MFSGRCSTPGWTDLVDFNYVRHHATGDDIVVFLAIGFFASVANIFLSLLNLFSSD
jgi:FtsH-binding integral membrane protein